MTLRVAHIGNGVQNAYLNAKFQRQAGINAHVYEPGARVIPAYHPAWEELAFTEAEAVPWPTSLLQTYQVPLFWHDEVLSGVPPSPGMVAQWLQQQWVAPEVTAFVVDYWPTFTKMQPSLCQYLLPIAEACREYDLVVCYGMWFYLAPFLEVPWLVFDFGSLPRLVVNTSPWGRFIQACVRSAARVLLTNAHTQPYADALGLSSVPVPHPIDTGRFAEAPPQFRADDHWILFAPARHGASANKRTAVLAAGAVPFLRTHPHARLWLRRPDQEADGAPLQAQLAMGGVTAQVEWLLEQSKPLMAEHYRQADIVLDQFGCGSFGSTTLEGMACGRPVITWVDQHLYVEPRWARVFPAPIPVCGARTPVEIYAQLERLTADSAAREDAAAAGRRWIEQTHAPEQVAALHRELYDEVLAARRTY